MDGLDGNGLLKTYALSMEKWRLEHLGALGIMDETVFRPRFEGQPRKTENEFNHNRLTMILKTQIGRSWIRARKVSDAI